MTMVNTSELKAKLSSYLAAVRRGETVVVCDRHTPIARLVPMDSRATDLDVDEPKRSPAEIANYEPVRLLKAVDPIEMLRQDRDRR
ncbi:MAG TPA: type II toxin-antitoxin system prevent-host-death family antitoxin [Acidobacteriota bacterium]|nr:type II toxin-antitoxin system prevent-host-death family antitoxin [Acidobacteriota bacterium]